MPRRTLAARMALCALLLSGASGAADAPLRLAEGVSFIAGHFAPGEQPDGNTVIFDAPGGRVVVDTGRHAQHAQRILESGGAATGPIAAIVNSHWHLDHISGNAAIRAAWPGAEVHAGMAIDDALSGFLARYRRQLEDAIAHSGDPTQVARWREEIARIDLGPRLRPTVPVLASGPREIAGKPFRLGLVEAATRGDVWIYDPATRVLAAGDLITLPAPFLDTACPRRWRDAFAQLAAIDFSVIVPGHGQPMDRENFNTYRRAFNNLLVCAETPTRPETCIAGWARDAAPLLEPQARARTDAMIGYYLEQRLRGPGATQDCAD